MPRASMPEVVISMPKSSKGPDWHQIIRASVRECLQTWRLQTRAGPVTAKALGTILARSTVLLMRRLEGQPPDLVVALLPGLIRTMLAAFVEVMAEDRRGKS